MSFSILPKELIITIFTYVNYETINDLDLHTSTKLYLTEINNKELQLHFINNYSFIEYKNNLVNSQYIFNIFFKKSLQHCDYINYLSIIKKDYIKKIILNSNPLVNNNYAVKFVCENNYTEFLKLLLQDKRIDLSFNDDYLIKYAYSRGYTKIIRLLLRDVRVDTNIGYCCQHYVPWNNICIILSFVICIFLLIFGFLMALLFIGIVIYIYHVFNKY